MKRERVISTRMAAEVKVFPNRRKFHASRVLGGTRNPKVFGPGISRKPAGLGGAFGKVFGKLGKCSENFSRQCQIPLLTAGIGGVFRKVFGVMGKCSGNLLARDP